MFWLLKINIFKVNQFNNCPNFSTGLTSGYGRSCKTIPILSQNFVSFVHTLICLINLYSPSLVTELSKGPPFCINSWIMFGSCVFLGGLLTTKFYQIYWILSYIWLKLLHLSTEFFSIHSKSVLDWNTRRALFIYLHSQYCN